MFKRSDKDRSPSQLAQRALLGIVARLAASCYLLYMVWQLWKDDSRDKTGSVIAVVLALFGVAFLVLTICDLIKSARNGYFNEESYYDLEYFEKALTEQKKYLEEHPEEEEDLREDIEALEKRIEDWKTSHPSETDTGSDSDAE